MYKEQIERHRKKVEQQTMHLVDNAKAEWRKRLSNAYDTHTEKIAKMKELHYEELESQRKWQIKELKKCQKDHEDEVSKTMQQMSTRLKDANDQSKKNLCESEEQTGSQLSNMIQDVEKKKAEWIAQHLAQSKKSTKKRVEEEKIILETERNTQIEALIRKFQKEESEAEENEKCLLTKESLDMQSSHQAQVKSLREKAKEFEQLRSTSEAAARSLEEEKIVYTKHISSLDEQIKKTKKEFEEQKIFQCDKEGVTKDLVSQINREGINKRNELQMQKQTMQKEIQTLRQEEEKSIHDHQKMIKTLETDHDMKLEAIEKQVRQTAALKDSKRVNVMNQIESKNIHLDRLRLILNKYTKLTTKEHKKKGHQNHKDLALLKRPNL